MLQKGWKHSLFCVSMIAKNGSLSGESLLQHFAFAGVSERWLQVKLVAAAAAGDLLASSLAPG